MSSGASSVSGLVLGTDGNPVITHSGHPTMLLWCNDRACLGNDESNQDINGTYCGGTRDVAIGADGFPIVSQANGGCVSEGTAPDRPVPGSGVRCAVGDGQLLRRRRHRPVELDRDRSGRQPSRQLLPRARRRPQGSPLRRPPCDGTGDTLSVVDSTGDVGTHTSLAIGKNGNPVIAYYDVTKKDLKVARCNDAACAGANETISTVDSAGRRGRVRVARDRTRTATR